MKYPLATLEAIIADYQSGMTADALALKYEYPKRSIIAKLVAAKIYVKKAYVSKTGLPPVSKENLIEQIAAELGLESMQIESLEKATKVCLQLILGKLVN